MADEPEMDDEWDEVLIDMRRFGVEQAVMMRAPGESLDDILRRAERIVEYLANGEI